MALAELRNVTTTTGSNIRPADEDLDLFGITHQGKVRSENQAVFLVCTVHPQVVVHGTSLADTEELPLRGTRLATILVVADGVGGVAGGSAAARIATEAVTRYVNSTLRCYHAAGSAGEGEFLGALRSAALEAHDAVRAEAAASLDQQHMASTLTVGIAVWPWFYAMQVGDSRCYLMSKGKLIQISRDQTLAEELVDKGVFTRDDAANSRFAHILSSAIGGQEAAPIVRRLEQAWDTIGLVCSDGLTRHVTDERIREQLASMTSARQVCEALLQDALDGGGQDNITIIVGRLIPRTQPGV